MSCYTRHLDLLPADPTPEDKRALDGQVRAVLGMANEDCSEVWAAVKARRSEVAADVLKARHDGEVA